MADPLDYFEAVPAPALDNAWRRPPREAPGGAVGEALREGALSVAPTAGGVAAFPLGAEAGGALGALGGPIGAGAGALVGGLAASFGGGYLIQRGQQWLIDHLDADTRRALTIDDETRALGAEQHPMASFLGSVAPQALFMRPGWNGWKAALGGAAIGGGVDAGQQYAETGHVDPWRAGAQSLLGGAFGHNNRVGETLQAPVRWLLEPPHPLVSSIPTGAGETKAGAAANDTLAAMPPDARPDQRTPDETAAMHVREAEALVRATNPYQPGPAGDAAHGEALATATAQVAAGEPVRVAPPPRSPAPADDDALIGFVIDRLEGGGRVVTDSGGVTKYGISAKAHPGIDIANLSRGEAAAILRREYLRPLGLEDADPAFRAVAFDAAVNSGPETARRMIAESGGDVDRLLALRRQRYAELIAKNPEKYGRYERGWENRLATLEEMADAHAAAPRLRREFEEASRLPDDLLDLGGELPETRGEGVQYHGARGELPTLTEGYYNPANIYGGFDTFYTTDALDVARGYGRKNEAARVYRIEEAEPVRMFDMEQARGRDELARVFGIRDAEADGFVPEAIDEAIVENGGQANLRQVMDEMRASSRNHDLSRDDVQEYFDAAIHNLREEGFGGMRHIGGLKTNRAPHEVRIYFDASRQVRTVEAARHAPKLPEPPAARDIEADAADLATREPIGLAADDAPDVRGGAPAFDDPHGPAAIDQADLIEHDLRLAIEADPSLAYRIDAEGDVVNIADLLADYDERANVLGALDACLKAAA